MTLTRSFHFLVAISFLCVGMLASGQSLSNEPPLSAIEGSDLTGQLQERQAKIEGLSADEQKLLLETRNKAMEDPAVKAALAARNEAANAFNAAVLASMIQSDPTVAAALQKVMTPSAPQ
ncbi:MAG: hypothetical protein ACR2NX_11830 [Chthoniobacterales bacterium]